MPVVEDSTALFYVYQVAKCGPSEYQLVALVTFVTDYVPDAVLSSLGLEHQDVLKKYADGVTSRRPAGAARKAFGCCANCQAAIKDIGRRYVIWRPLPCV